MTKLSWLVKLEKNEEVILGAVGGVAFARLSASLFVIDDNERCDEEEMDEERKMKS